ncbi:MAG: aldo/keto reductase [Magnetococcales bacterium]|nr:aldo/keto reductase [Magnetococcales bacterium]
MKRRDFMKSTAVATALTASGAFGATALTAEAARSDKPMVRRYSPLGKTGVKMGDIAFGAGRLPSASLILRAIDRGVNYIDTAPDYGPSEDLIGDALTRFRQRDKVYIASKFCHPIPYQSGRSHLQVGSSRKEYIESVESSLKRLGTDYLDVVFVHAIGEKASFGDEKARLVDDEMLEAVEVLKKQGKIRALAVSSHGPHNMEKLMLEAVRSGHFDAIMPAFNFMQFPKLPEVLDEAYRRGVGVVAMKTLAGDKKAGAKSGGPEFAQAAFKWVLKHPGVSGLVITMKSVSDLDRYIPASGQGFTPGDQKVLDRYAALHGMDYCRTGCGDCEAGCDEGVPVATILRQQMYFEDYGDEKRAMQGYAHLTKSAAACLACSGDPCNDGCAYGLKVGGKLRAAHRTLSFDLQVG